MDFIIIKEHSMADQKLSPEPGIAYVKANFRPDAVAFPLRVKIPAALARDNGVARRYIIQNADKPIPEDVLNWLKKDARYKDWFEDVERETVTEETPDTNDEE